MKIDWRLSKTARNRTFPTENKQPTILNTIQQRNEAFKQSLSQLNAEQRAAVQHFEGPALVVAGPGTGKTHLLATRIGNILVETDTPAASVLCLTFTDAGAQAIRERLLQILGNEGHRVAVHTFHSFCSKVIAEHPEFFGYRDVEPISDLERLEIIRNLLDKLPENTPLRLDRKHPFVFETHLRHLFTLMKRENWSPGYIHRSIRNHLEQLPHHPEFIYKRSGKGFKKGDLKTDLIDLETQKMERLAAAADLFPKFKQAMLAAGRYDFDDMILWTIEALDRHKTLRLQYQERFLYILVDEFQDTNGAQNRLLELLTDFWEHPNLFIVGDDDQSIYEFQGARLKNLRDFYEKYRSELLLTVLAENYRSGQAILEAASRVIQHNQLRAVRLFDPPLEKNLRAHHDQLEAKVEVRKHPNVLAEMVAVVSQIIDFQEIGVPLNHIAILYREHKHADLLMKLLIKKNIPFETKRPENVLAAPLIRQWRTLLEYLRDERQQPFSGEHRVFEWLHFRCWQLPPIEVARLATWLAGQPLRWREAIGSRSVLQQAGVSDADVFLKISNTVERWLGLLDELPLLPFLEQVLNESGLLKVILASSERIFWFEMVQTLLDFAQKELKRQSQHTAQNYSLSHFLEQLDTLEANKMILPVQQHIRTGTAGVQLLTAHASKGLEFEHVFVIQCHEDAWEKKRTNNQKHFSLPETLTFSTTEDETEALRRLFYVACTRAKTSLSVSFSEQNEKGKPQLPTQFVWEMQLPIETVQPSEASLADAQFSMLLASPTPEVLLPESSRLDVLLEDFALSPTSFNRFLRCPLAFYYQDVLRVPDFSSEAAVFGQAMHHALQANFLQMKKSTKRAFPSENWLVDAFEKEMTRLRHHFKTEHFKQHLAYGKRVLAKYRAEKLPTWQKNSEVERRITRVELAGVPMTGVIDRIERLENGKIRVIDYKTGAFKSEKVRPPNEKQPFGGEFWRQMFFYKILFELQQPSAGEVSAGVISYLEPDSKTGNFRDVEFRFEAQHVDWVKKWIVEVDEKIRQRQFTKGCGERDCTWCLLQSEQTMPTVFENLEEDLDDF